MFSTKPCSSFVTAVLFLTSSVDADIWDVREKSLGAALAYEGKTNDDARYEGTKLFIDGRYFFNNEAGETSDRRKCCTLPSQPEYYYGLVDAQLRFGFEDTGLEFAMLDFTPWATVYKPSIESSENLRATSDLVRLGAIRYISDDPLDVDYYLELSVFRAGRNGIYQWNRESPHAFTGGVQLWAGWAWSETNVAGYSEVSNPFVGINFNLAWEHASWGSLYMENRFVNGFSFSNPSRGHPMVREARVAFGYLKELSDRIALDIIFEKKSFYFDEGGLPGLYRMSRAAAVDLSYRW